MARGLGPAVPIGFGGVMDWLLEHGYITHPSEMLEMLENGAPSRPRAKASPASRTRARTLRIPEKKKRKVSAYQKEFGRQLKKLKRAHPRTPVTRLMKRAHAATKRARRGK